jgi:uncharacterized protein YaiI (UPF0178 family)
MTDIYIDADACPVKDEAIRVAERHGLAVHVVGNTWLRKAAGPLVNKVVVPEEPDAADDWIADHISESDICITGDIPLAGRCVEKGAAVLGHSGRPFTQDSIGMALAMRDLKTHLRETREIKDHHPAFSTTDRSRFLSALEDMVRTVNAKG